MMCIQAISVGNKTDVYSLTNMIGASTTTFILGMVTSSATEDNNGEHNICYAP